mgnify:CR=1 FL=1
MLERSGVRTGVDLERLIDTAAREMRIDRIELRRRNHIAPEAMPYKAPSGMAYDSGEFTAVLDKALQASDWDGFDARKAESKARGKLRIEYRERNEGYKKLRESLLAVGDIVDISEDAKNPDTWIIESVEKRRNAVHRASFGRQAARALRSASSRAFRSASSPAATIWSPCRGTDGW